MLLAPRAHAAMEVALEVLPAAALKAGTLCNASTSHFVFMWGLSWINDRGWLEAEVSHSCGREISAKTTERWGLLPHRPGHRALHTGGLENTGEGKECLSGHGSSLTHLPASDFCISGEPHRVSLPIQWLAHTVPIPGAVRWSQGLKPT